MNSRPGKGKKPDFQPGASGRLPEREEACKPANNKPEVLFDFNMLHELAHSIDDAQELHGAPRASKPDHGGWIAIGGNVELIAERSLPRTPASARRRPNASTCIDKILRNPRRRARRPSTGDKAKFEKFITAAQTAKRVGQARALTEQATLGKRVYQEAYPNTWYSYLADRAQARHHQLPVPRAGRMVLRAVRGMEGRQAQARPSVRRLAEASSRSRLKQEDRHVRLRHHRARLPGLRRQHRGRAGAQRQRGAPARPARGDPRPQLPAPVVCPSCGTTFRVEPMFTYLDIGAQAVRRGLAGFRARRPGRRLEARSAGGLRQGLRQRRQPTARALATGMQGALRLRLARPEREADRRRARHRRRRSLELAKIGDAAQRWAR